MRGSVRKDITTRIITVEVSGTEDMDATERWHAKPRIFRPDHVTIRTVDGELCEVKASGPLVLKSGGVSVNSLRENQTWHPDGAWDTGHKLSEAPEWVQRLAQEAPAGVTSWASPEVQPL